MTQDMSTAPAAAPAAPASADPARPELPLFYSRPEPVTSATHGQLALRTMADFRFAAKALTLPVLAVEFAASCRDYPIVFCRSGDQVWPLLVVGVQDRNLFVDPAGAWAPDSYLPAYVRRYPFVGMEMGDGDTLALGLDAGAGLLVPAGEAGARPLFDGAEPSDFTREALAFCQEFQAGHAATRRFAADLLAEDLLVPRQARFRFATGSAQLVDGFLLVDADKLRTLPDERVLAWHRNGYLALIQHHLLSQQRWQRLLQLAEPAAAAA